MKAALKDNLNKLIPATALIAVASTSLLAAGCGGDDTTSKASSTAASKLPQGSEKVKLDPAEFTTEITNRYWPMKPGTKWVYSEVEDGHKNRVDVKVLNKTKTIANGVEARVVRDVVSAANGQPVEVTSDYYAQDRKGNIWYLGEKTAEYENGKVSTTEGSFEAGAKGAQAGIAVPADPKPGLGYRQEYLAGQAEDNGKVLSIDDQVQVPAGHYTNALLTKDLNPLEAKKQEYKLYAKGVGPVLELLTSGGSGRAELVSYTPGK